MKKIVRILLLAILILPLMADAAVHYTVITWNASGDTGATYNVFKASGSCPASGIPTGATKIASGLTALTFTDSASTLTAGQVNCYYVTAQVNGTESGPSNTAGATTPVATASNCKAVGY